MNLQETLNRRTKCLVHSASPLKARVFSPDYRKDHILVNERGLHLLSHSPHDLYGKPSLTGLGFRYDGTYYRNSACPKWIEDGALFVYMMCDACAEIPIHKERSLGFISLMEVRTMQYYYSFSLLPIVWNVRGADNGYGILLDREKVKYTEDDKFYHIDIDLVTKQASCKIGSCDGTIIVSDMISKMNSIDLPALDLQKFEKIDQLVEKLRIYNLFS